MRRLVLLISYLICSVTHADIQPSQTEVQSETVIPKTFNFKYDGDINNVLETLQAIQPQIEVLPVQGNIIPLPIHIDLHGTNLPNTLRAIGEEGGNMADVVWHISKHHGGKVFIKFLSKTADRN